MSKVKNTKMLKVKILKCLGLKDMDGTLVHCKGQKISNAILLKKKA